MDEYKEMLLHSIIRPFPDNTLLVDICERSKDVIHDTFLLSSVQYMDNQWFKKSIQYTKDLPIYDKHTLRSYTHNGDLLINKYVRNNTVIYTEYIVFATQLFKLYDELSDSYYNEEFALSEEGVKKAEEIVNNYKLNVLNPNVNITRLRKVIEAYIQEFRELITNAPRCENDLIVFRGIDEDYALTDDKWKVMKGFHSASYSLDSACTFRKTQIYEFVLTKNTPCLALEYVSRYSHEREIIFCDKLLFHVGHLNEKYTIDSVKLDSHDNKFTECNYILNKIIDPAHDIVNNVANDNNNLILLPKQIEITKRIYCKENTETLGQIGGKKTVKNTLNRQIHSKTTRKNTRNILSKNPIIHVGSEDRKSRFTEPMIVSKSYTRLPESVERDFYQRILNCGGEKDAPIYLKELYPEIKKQIK